MRILYLTHYFPPEIGAASSRAYSMVRWLARFGHEVSVLTGFPSYLMEDMPESYRGRRWMQEDMDGMVVYRAWRYTSSSRSNWRRMANYLSFVASAWWYGRRLSGPFDVIVVSSPPLFLGLAGVALSRYWHVPMVLEVRDIWPETAVDVGVFKAGSLMERIWSHLADFIYHRAAGVVAVTRDIHARLQARGVPAELVHFVPNGVDLELVDRSAPSARKRLGLEDKFVALFAGLIGVMQNVVSVVEAAALLQENEQIHFLIVGGGARREEVAQRIADLKLSNVTLLPPQPREEMPGILNMADVCLATLAKDVRGAVPYKLLEAWAYEKPIVAAVGDEGGSLVEECQGGISVPGDDPQALAAAILQIFTDRKSGRVWGRNGRRCIEERLNREVLTRKMESVLLAVVNSAEEAPDVSKS